MILLANSFFLRRDPKQRERMKPYSPLATLMVASALRARGHDVALFDATLASGVDAFAEMLHALQPTIVGILEDNFNFLTKMCTVHTRAATLEMVRLAHRAGCRVAVNGSDSSDHPALYEDAGADVVLLGEVDASFPALVERWLRGEASNVSTSRVTDLDALPFPAWDLVDVDAYRDAWQDAHGRLSWNMVTSRGCPFGCNWCAKPIFGRRYAQRSPSNVAAELRALKDAVRPDHIWFADDIFGLTAAWIGAFADAVIANDTRTPFTIQCRADLLTDDIAAALARAGCEEVWIGVESGSQAVLDAMEKGTTVDEVRQATRALKAHGIRAAWFLQLGYPAETWDDVVATRDLVRDERPDDVGVSVAYPLPGTTFHARVRDEIGRRTNWQHSDDLAMLFHGTYTTPFYRRLRDALHVEVRTGVPNGELWNALEQEEVAHRSRDPLVVTRT